MATLQFNSIEEIKKLAKENNLSINPQITSNAKSIDTSSYVIPEKYRTKFNNAVNFYLNSTIKHSEELDKYDTDYSKEFARLLTKYYEEALTDSDVLELLMLAHSYNETIDTYIEENKFNILLDSSYFNKIKAAIKKCYDSLDGDKYDVGDDYFDYLTYIYLANQLGVKDSEIVSGTITSTNNVVNYASYTDSSGNKQYYIDEDGKNINLASVYTYYYSNITYNNKNYQAKFISYITNYEVNNDQNNAYKELSSADTKEYVHTSDNIVTNISDSEFNDFQNSLISAATRNINDGSYNVYDPSTYLAIIENQLKILYKVYHSTSTTSTDTKLSASNDEVLEANNGMPISYFNILNLSLDSEDYSVIKSYVGNNLVTSTNTTIDKHTSNKNIISIGLIYKELNSAYRELEQADLVDLGLSVLIQNGYSCFGETFVDSVVNPTLNASIEDVSDVHIFDDDSYYTDMLASLRANPYFARKSSKSDIIQYYVGSFGNYSYGTTDEEKLEIYNILELYKETRDMYYKRLLNKAFVYDDMYDAYEEFYIIGFTIIRFINSKLDHLNDVDYFDEDDVHDFLMSYGLFALDESKVFAKQLEYKKKIIKNFADLIRWKGSSDVVSKIVSIFTDSDSTMTLSKYMLVQKTEEEYDSKNEKMKIDEGDLKFVKLDYNTTNEMKDINNKLSSASSYDSFLAKDDYWDSETVKESDIKALNINSETTKYASFDLAVDISSPFLKEVYALSAINYLYDTLTYKIYNKADDDQPLLSTIKFEGSFLNGNLTSFSLYEMFSIITYMYAKYLELEGAQFKTASGEKYFGINRDASYSNLVLNNNMLDKTVFTNGEENGIPVFNPYVKLSDKTYASGLANYPDALTINQNDTSYSSAGLKFNNIFDEVVFDTSNSDGAESYTKLAEYLKFINYVSLINSDDYSDYALPYFLSNFKSSDASICVDIVNGNTNNYRNLENIYTYLISGLIQFPYDYLNGIKNPDFDNNLYYNKEFMDFEDKLFNEFFITKNNPAIDYSDTSGTNIDSQIKSYIDGLSVTELSEELISFLTDCKDILTNESLLQITLSLDSDISNMLEFIIAAIKIFISYTSEIYEAKTAREYKSKGESIILYDDVKYSNKSVYADYMPYNEKFEVTKNN